MAHKLLLADDSVTIQRVIELTFADEDVQVLAVGDGKQAIERLETERPDIVLADVGMPERDGYEVASFIKGNPRFAHIPVLLLTGAFEPVDEARAKSAGCDGVLVKPFEPQMVINRVKDLLAGRPPGLWGPPPPAPARQPVPEAVPARGPGSDRPASPSGSLEDYFDRLDAAFGGLDSGAHESPRPAPPAGPSRIAEFPAPVPAQADVADALAGWDPEILGDPGRAAAAAPEPAAAEPHPVQPVAVTPEPPASPPALKPVPAPPALHALPPPATAAPEPLPSLADAFAALLAAERNLPVPAAPVRPVTVGDDVVEEIVQKVIARLSDQAVRQTVLDVAERLVREEIERIKRS